MRIDKDIIETVRMKFKQELAEPIELVLFTTDLPTGSCDNRGYNEFAQELLEILAELSNRISLSYIDLYGKEGRDHGLVASPTILIGANGRYPVQYWGAPTGHQGGTFIDALITASRRETELSADSRTKIHRIDHETLLECFVTPDCQYCPLTVRLANQIALESGGIVTARCIDIIECMDRALEFDVSSVPCLVINEDKQSAMVGVKDEQTVVNEVFRRGASTTAESLEKEKTVFPDHPDYPLDLSEDTIDRAIETYPFLVIDCRTSWCAPCTALRPVVDSLARSMKENVVFGRIDIDANAQIATRFGIQSLPTLLIFKGGVHAGTLFGVMTKEALAERILAYR